MNNELVNKLVEVKLRQPDDFLKVKETLTRIGVASKKEKTLYQSCHILHKQGRYFIVHFKELFALDARPTNISDEDIGRRNAIIDLLDMWKLVEIVDKAAIQSPKASLNQIKILSFSEKGDWVLEPKYNIGKKKQ